MTLEERFWSKVDKNGPGRCWLWTASKFHRGYGKFRVGEKHCLAHRVAWELENGEIPKSLQVLHCCDVPTCVNPAHLFLGTNNDNSIDMMRKRRHKTALGEEVGCSKLTTKKVLEIHSLKGTISQREIAKLFGISTAQISLIINRKCWRHI